MDQSILNNFTSLNNYGNINIFLKSLTNFYNNNFIDLRQINEEIDTIESYSVTSTLQDWTTSYYSLPSSNFPYLVLVMHEVYDCIQQGFCTVNTNIGVYTDFYLMNSTVKRNCANLYLNGSTALTSSVTSTLDVTMPFIDYSKGIAIFPSISSSYISNIIGGAYYDYASYDYETYDDLGSSVSSDIFFDSIAYNSSVRIKDNQFICIVKSSDFLKTSNPSAYNSLTGTVSGFTVPYVTTVGIYDDAGNLLMIGKFDRPVKMSNKIDIIIKLQMDM